MPVVGDFAKEDYGIGGTVLGTVRDSNGGALAFATVELVENPELCFTKTVVTGRVTTDANGFYRFATVDQQATSFFRALVPAPDDQGQPGKRRNG